MRPGGPVIGSVMSTLGSWRAFLPSVVQLSDPDGEEILRTGDLRPTQPTGHVCQMYTADGLTALVERAGGRIIDASASNWASIGDPETLALLEADPQRWASFLDQEEWACRRPGALDGGTHLLFAAIS